MYRKLCVFSAVDKCKEIKGALVWLVHLEHSGCLEATAEVPLLSAEGGVARKRRQPDPIVVPVSWRRSR